MQSETVLEMEKRRAAAIAACVAVHSSLAGSTIERASEPWHLDCMILELRAALKSGRHDGTARAALDAIGALQAWLYLSDLETIEAESDARQAAAYLDDLAKIAADKSS